MRNTLLISALLPACLLAAVEVVAAPPDWAQWRGPRMDGITSDVAWQAEGVPLWKKNVGLGYSSVCVSNGRLFTHGFDEKTNQDILVCLDPMTGDEAWRHAWPAKKWDTMHEGGTLTTPVAEGDRVYVLSRMGNFFCFDGTTGTVVWEVKLDTAHDVSLGNFGLPASPAILEEGLLINVGKVMLFDKASGELKWATRDYGYSYSVPVPFQRGDTPMLAVFNAEGFVTMDRADGTQRMQLPWTSQYNVNCATPIVMGSKIFISTGYDDKGCAMVDVSGDELKVVWESKVMRNNMTGCVLLNDHLYGFDKTMLKCIDLDGKELWRERGLGNGTVLASADGRLIVLSEKGELIFAPASPEGFAPTQRTTVFSEGTCWTTPVLTGGLLYVRNNKGDIICRDHRKPSNG